MPCRTLHAPDSACVDLDQDGTRPACGPSARFAGRTRTNATAAPDAKHFVSVASRKREPDRSCDLHAGSIRNCGAGFFAMRTFPNVLPELRMEPGRSGGIRTPGPLVPNQMRYQAALHSDGCLPSGLAAAWKAANRRAMPQHGHQVRDDEARPRDRSPAVPQGRR